jgi:hypothetical protein
MDNGQHRTWNRRYAYRITSGWPTIHELDWFGDNGSAGSLLCIQEGDTLLHQIA